MSIKATAIIKKGSARDERTSNKYFYATLTLLNEAGKEYGVPRNFSGFDEVGATLRREAGVTHEQLQDRYPRYDRGEEVRLSLLLDNDEAIRNLGFDPRNV